MHKSQTNIIKYKLYDEYLIFYFKFIQPYKSLILNDTAKNIFKNKIKNQWLSWLGFAFENFCLKYHSVICHALGLQDIVEAIGPYFERKNSTGFQIDLLIQRSDKTWTVCECKYHENPIDVEIIKEMEKKIQLLKVPRGISIQKALITVNGVTSGVKKMEYFDHILSIEDFFRSHNSK